ncbi:uncharacterized protein DUF748 [Nitrosospira multiformis]|uniref:Uncharacterized protein DUF748 n=1 Tax=Nitrosospira multiformis TaxID=1231 RepID=A0A2T5I527_9PROT|nr:uncharacterized protein DUF748 [Nitrosospira multiformis]
MPLYNFENTSEVILHMKRIIAHPVFRRSVGIVSVLLLVYTLAGFLVLPYWLERFLPDYLEQRTGQDASVGDIRINPYLFTVEVSDVQLGGMAESPLMTFKRLYIDFELSSIFTQAWRFADIRTEGLDLALEIDREGRLNVIELIERLKSREEASKTPMRVILEHLVISDARISLSDLSGEKPASAILSPINLVLTDLTTIPDREGQYVLQAKSERGGSLEWKGDITLFPLASRGYFALRELELANIWQFFREELRIAKPQGEVGVAANYDFSYKQGKASLELSKITLQLANLSVTQADGRQPLIELGSVHIDDARFSLDDREIAIPVFALSKGKASASRADNGQLNWQSLLKKSTAAADSRTEPVNDSDLAERPASPSFPWKIHIEHVDLEDIGIAYTDYSLSPPLAFRIDKLGSKFKLGLSGLVEAPRLQVQAAQLSISGVVVAPVSRDAALLGTLGNFELSGGSLDTEAQTVAAESINVSGGEMAFIRGPDGPRGLLRLLHAAQKPKEDRQSPPAVDPTSTKSEETAWKYRIGSLDLKQFRAQLADETYKPIVAYDIDAIAVTAENIDNSVEKPVVFNAKLKVNNNKGVINGSGTARQDFKQASVKLDAKVPLEPLQGVVARHAAASLVSGRLVAATELNYHSGATPEITVAGSASIKDFRLNESDTTDRLIAWKALLAQKFKLSMDPNRLSVKEIHLHEPDLKLAIDEEMNVNLAQVLRNSTEAKESPEGHQRKILPEKTGARQKDNVFPVEIAQVRIEEGSLDFADKSLVLPFSTHVTGLKGIVAGISTAPRNRAEIRLSGQVEDYGEAKVAGTLSTSNPKRFLDIAADFENIKMPPLSPYSATFAGRKIAAGKLWLTLHYKIVKGKLLGENKIMLADFKLGERVEAPGALDLPLDLAIALLKGPNDRINLAVPVRGDLGNPSFDYGLVIRTALATVLRRIVTSPFRLLAGSEEETENLRKVEFEPGSDDIQPSQREQLDVLAEAIKQRPEVALVVQGPYDAEVDGKSLRRQQVHRDVLAEADILVEESEDLDFMAFGNADIQKALERLLARRSEGGPAEFADTYKKRTGREPDRVNPLLGLFGRGSRDREFYEAMFDRLVELQPLSGGELEALAASRAKEIIAALRRAGVDSKQVIVGDIEAVAGKARDAVVAELSLQTAPAEN